MAGTGKKQIVVTGDVSIDWLAWPWPPESHKTATIANWRLREGTRMVPRRGGALLLGDLLRAAGLPHDVVGPGMPDNLRNESPDKHLHSIVDLEPNEKPDTFRISRLRGFCGPDLASLRQPQLESRIRDVALLVFDDSGNGFRDDPEAWQQLFATARPDWLILKMARPLADGGLWKLVRGGPLRGKGDGKADPDRLVVVVNADDLREEGYGLTRPLTWERTAEEFVREVASNQHFEPLRDCAHLIVRFDCDGVIHYRGGTTPAATLYFDPLHAEGGFVARQKGRMMGMTAAFTAGLAAALANGSAKGPADAIPRGMTAARRVAAGGFVPDTDKSGPTYPREGVLKGEPDAIPAEDIPLDHIASGKLWSILHTRANPIDVAMRVVIDGPSAATGIPVADFGKFQTADRREIEAFRAIGNLLGEYLEQPPPKPGEQSHIKPISIGVFGRPGSGKSYGVTEVAKHIAGQVSKGQEVKKIDINVSQFTSLADLTAAFHLIRDCSLSGKIPLAFFDEFDSASDDGELGWLRYFLAPMQDGEFSEGGHKRPIGKAIFVFAGGTRDSFKQFVAPMNPEKGNDEEAGQRRSAFAAAKGPDFASRLRGTVDILGPDWLGDDDPYPIRRAFLLRSVINRDYKHLMSKEKVNIADDLLKALLTVRGLRHGARSIEAILAMSGLSGGNTFVRADLPPPDQLGLHVDADDFMGRVNGERLDYELREALGEYLHNAYRSKRREIAEHVAELRMLDGDLAMKDWDDLDEVYRESSRLQADDIRRKLRMIGCCMKKEEDKQRVPVTEFSGSEIDHLAREEHERLNTERWRRNWRLGSRDLAKRRSPHLKSWEEIGEKWQKLDINAVETIPGALKSQGWFIYRKPLGDSSPPPA